MNVIISSFSILCFLLAFLAGFILFFVNKEQVFSNRLLALVLFFLGIQNFISFLLYSGYLTKIPHIYRVFGPSTFLILPVSYFYVRSILKLQTKFQSYDWLVLIPSILYAIDLLPVYTLSYEKKLVLVKYFVEHPILHGQYSDGILPPYVFSFIRTAWSAFFIFLQFKQITQFRKNVSNQIIQVNKELLNWLTLFSQLMLILVSVFVVFTVMAPIFKSSTKLTEITLQLTVFIITFKLFTKPQILYGIFVPSEKINNNSNTAILKNDIVNLDVDIIQNNFFNENSKINLKYKEKIETHFKDNVPFLNANYTLNHLSDEIDLPKYVVSSFINQEYGIGFRKFLNTKRIEYLLENYNKPAWKNLTIEAIANDSGFKNKSTFITNFKEVTGKTPLEYLKNIRS